MTEHEEHVVKGLHRDINKLPPYVDLIGDEAVLDGHFKAWQLRRIALLLEEREQRMRGVRMVVVNECPPDMIVPESSLLEAANTPEFQALLKRGLLE